MIQQACCNKNMGEQFTCGQLRVEIDRLKSEVEYTKEMSNAFMDERNNLKIQLAEARAENKRLSAVVVEIANSGFGMNGNTPCTACEYNVNLCQKGLEG